MINFKQFQHEQLINFTEKENKNNIHVHMLTTLVLNHNRLPVVLIAMSFLPRSVFEPFATYGTNMSMIV